MLEKQILLKDYIKNFKKENLENVLTLQLLINFHEPATSLESITMSYNPIACVYTLSVYNSLISIPIKFFTNFSGLKKALNNIYKKAMVGNWQELKIYSIIKTERN